MQCQVSHMSNTLKDTKVMTHIKTMQAKHLISEKSELQTMLQDRDQQLRIIQGQTQVLPYIYKYVTSSDVDNQCIISY